MRCERCGDPVEEWHTCPYAEDLYPDGECEECNCCAECTQECLWEI